LANPYQVKNIPSQKTDPRDSEWLADLLAHGLIRPSFVPSPEIRHVRELTRYRVQLSGEHNRVHNRIHKVLEDANIKLDTVLSDLLGVSGRAMLRSIIGGETDPGGWPIMHAARCATSVSSCNWCCVAASATITVTCWAS
jgi:transposase